MRGILLAFAYSFALFSSRQATALISTLIFCCRKNAAGLIKASAAIHAAPRSPTRTVIVINPNAFIPGLVRNDWYVFTVNGGCGKISIDYTRDLKPFCGMV